MFFYTSNNFSLQPAGQITNYVSYVPTDPNGIFINQTITLPVPSGSYFILVKSEGSLLAVLNNAQPISLVTNQNNQLGNSLQTLSMGDLDNNNSINSADYNILVDCFGDKATSSTCTDHNISDETKGLFPDINDDGIVDLIDYNILIRHFGESGL